nr:tetratricopeptide repeat protein 27 isoform X2 [Ziziphus jujuba var. spinosa]
MEEEFLRACELRLLRCTLPSPPPSACSPKPQSESSHRNHLRSLIHDLLHFIETGTYLQAITNPDFQRLVVFKLIDSNLDDSPECAGRVYSEFLIAIESFLKGGEDANDSAYRVMVVMCIAVAAFLAFTQCNMTGPLESLPKCPLPLRGMKGNDNKFVGWDSWARNQLMAAGSDLLGKFSYLQYIVFAKMLLVRMKDLLFEGSVSVYGIRSITWWLARLLLLHQRILDDRSSSLFDLLQVFMHDVLHHFGTLEKVLSYWGSNLHNDEGLTIVSMVHLEAGIMEYTYGRVDSCRLYFNSAEEAAGLHLSVTGALGFRTLYQVEPKAQMVLVADTSSTNTGKRCLSVSCDPQTQVSSISDNNSYQSETYEGSDILMTPKLLENDNESEIRAKGIKVGGTGTPLSATHQAVILAKCLLIEKSTRHDEMQRWDMAPYIEAIDSQQSSYFIIRCFCDILRVRWESTRSRTKERALVMMDKLVQGIYEPSPGVAQRIPFCYGAYIPSVPALRKEYGELLVRCGLIGEAVKIFEDLELWDNLILCYRLMEKKAAAVDLIKVRLSEMPNDPRLWCSLGDVTNNDSCYEKALEVSNNRSARAKRSLARSAYNRGDYEKSKILWESAMALNSLYQDGWFALGAAALKAKDVEKALDGFTRAVQLDPENGEAWNNIACLHMIRKKSKEAFVAFREALKFKRNSWQLWENYSQVAFDVGNLTQALEAVRMVLEISSNKRVDAELLEKIMAEVEKRASISLSTSTAMTDNNNSQVCPDDSQIVPHNELYAESGVERSRETEHLLDSIGKVLQQIVRSGNGSDIWGLYARWHRLKGDLTMCSEALLKQVRSYQGSDLWKDRDRFRRFAHASLELCKVYMEISSSTGSRKELLTAEMHLKNILKQA